MKMPAVLLVLAMLVHSYTQAQSTNNDSTQNYKAVAYRLFPTQNMWTFIKLDTRNGRMWQVQFHLEANLRFETFLNLEPQVTKENEVNERFTLYPTQNIYNFILLDQLDGRTWQVQWSTEPKNRGIMPIE